MKSNASVLRPSEARQRLVDTASRLFYKQGYNLTGINQLIDEAGVAKASLYQHFASKEALLIAYLAKASTEWFTQLTEHVSPYDTPKTKVLAAFDLLLNFSESVSFRGCNFQNIISEVPHESEAVRSVIRIHKAKMRQFFTDLMGETEHSELADAVTVLFEGALIAGQTQQASWPVQSAHALLTKLL